MSIGTNTPRLLAAAKEFNIGKETLLEFLDTKGFDVSSFKPNSKLSEEMYDALQDEFAKDKAAKRKSDSIALPKGSLMDNLDKSKEELDLSAKDKKATTDKTKATMPEPVEETPQPPAPVEEPQEETPVEDTPKEPVVETPEPASPAVEDRPVPATKEVEEVPVEETAPKADEQPETKAEPASEKETTASEEPQKEMIAEDAVASDSDKPETPAATDDNADEETVQHIEMQAPKLEGPKVLDKINLDSLNLSTRPKKGAGKKEKEAPAKKETTPAKEVKKAEPAPPKKETPPAVPAAPEKQEPNKTEEPPAPIHIQTNAPKLEGPRVIGKIELPVSNAHSRHDSKEKRKRKRIPVDKKHEHAKPGVDVSQRGGPGRNRNNNNNNRPGGRGTDNNSRNKKGNSGGPQEIDAKEIQEKIKETQAKLAGGGSRNKNLKAKYRRNKREERAEKRAAEEMANEGNVIQVTEFISVSELANLLDVSFADVISKCMSLGIMVSINQRLDAEVIELVASEFDTEVEFINLEDKSEEEEEQEEDNEEDLEPRAPVVTIMGHVDHGKTSLLDYIRSASVVAGEAGGITQHIGAYRVTTASGKNITFLDTPGHEAFTAMRARGAKAADVAIIVIAADDAIMPQTREAISHAQAASLPMVFAINKIDKEGANPEKIREQLSAMNILVEDWGGNYQCQEISAKKGLNIEELLEKVLLEAEMLELKANPNKNAVGSVIEASLDKGRGYVSTILVHAGTLHQGEMIVSGQYFGKVRAMTNERGQRVTSAGPSTPVQVLGLNGAPQAGEKFKVYTDESEAKSLANHRSQILREQGLRSRKHITLDEIGRRLALGNFKELNVIIKADFDGSAEALSDSLQKLSTEEVVVNVVLKGVGQIKESDVMLASASDAIILGFQVRPSSHAARLAEEENIEIRQYSIIYDAIAEIKSAMEGMLEPKLEKKVVGNIEVRETFKISGVGVIAGCYVTDGKISRNTKINLIRDGIVVHTGELASLKRFKDDVKDVSAGYECGLALKNYNDIQVGDILEGYEEIEVKRKL